MTTRITNMTTQRLTEASCALGLLAYVGLTTLFSVPEASAFQAGGPPAQIELIGIVRDFRERTVAMGHPDFEAHPVHGFKLYCGNVSPYLSPAGKPAFTGTGHKVVQNWTDDHGRPICYHVAEAYPAPGDSNGTWGPADSGGIDSEVGFKQWFRDMPGINMSMLLTLTLVRQLDGTYVFDDRVDPLYSDLGGFFPIEDQLFGNPGGYPDRNFHFTFELSTEFVYDPDAEQLFKFVGDDDVWVFIDGELPTRL